MRGWNETPFCGSQTWYSLQGFFAHFFIPKNLHPCWAKWIMGTLMAQNLCTQRDKNKDKNTREDMIVNKIN